MQAFYASEIVKISNLLKALNGVMDKYNRRDVNVLPELLQWLDTAVRTYHELGQLDKESRCQALKTEVVTAQRGINPLTFEKITLRRNEMQLTIAFKVMQAAEAQVRSDLTADTERLKEATELLGQVIVAGLQTGLLTGERINKVKSQEDIRALWQALSADANIALGKTRALLLVSEYDILILLGDLLAGLRTQKAAKPVR